MTTSELVYSTGAWDRWRDEVRRGRRSATSPTDALYCAAFADANGLDCLDDGLLSAAATWFDQSARYLVAGLAR